MSVEPYFLRNVRGSSFKASVTGHIDSMTVARETARKPVSVVEGGKGLTYYFAKEEGGGGRECLFAYRMFKQAICKRPKDWKKGEESSPQQRGRGGKSKKRSEGGEGVTSGKEKGVPGILKS